MWQMTIPATLVSATGSPLAECSLDPNVMADKGGSLIVESRQDEPSFGIRSTGRVPRRPRRRKLW